MMQRWGSEIGCGGKENFVFPTVPLSKIRIWGKKNPQGD
jgi:hypothetical protein